MADVELSEIASIMAGNDPEPVVEIPEPVEAEQSEEIQTASEEPEQAAVEVEIPTRLTVTEIAEKLDLTPEQLYSALQIKVGDSEVSLSTLKDGVNDLERANELRESAQSHKTESENDILRQRRELALAQQRYQPTQAEQAQSERDFTAYVQRENAAAVMAIPEWAEPGKEAQGRDAVAGLLRDYAFSSAEVATMVDHRYVKMAHDFALVRQRMTKATEVVKDTKRQTSKGKRTAPTTGIDKAKKMYAAGELSRDATVAAIIANGRN
jgi:hypothetical protein